MKTMQRLPLFLLVTTLVSFLCSGCHYSASRTAKMDSIPEVTRDSLKYLDTYHYTLGTNLIVNADTLLLSQLPIVDKYDTLFRGDTVAVAEFMTSPIDSTDTVWVKVARDQVTQGWIQESKVDNSFLPTATLSHLIYLFSRAHSWLFGLFFSVFIILFVTRGYLKKRLQLVFYHDIDSAYPILLCFLTAFSATMYESIQLFCPETWEHFYFNPTLSPFGLPAVLGLFLMGVWSTFVVFLAAIDETFKMLRPAPALAYLIGLVASCIISYLTFILVAHIYIGYLLLIYFAYRIIRRALGRHTYHYRCGRCGNLLRKKGKCPNCGSINE